MKIEINLDTLEDQQLFNIIFEATLILNKRSSGITKTRKTETKPKKKKGKYSKLDEFVKTNHEKMSAREMVIMAREEGIITNKDQINYRKRELGLQKNNRCYKENPHSKDDPLESVPKEEQEE